MTARPAKASQWLGLVVCVLCSPTLSFADEGERPVGDATVRVVTANGEPWASGTLLVSGCVGVDSVPVTNGLAELNDVPAGPLELVIYGDGYATRRLQGEIVAGETVDLGEMQALTIEEGTGVVVGRMRWAGRGRPPGMTLNNISPYETQDYFEDDYNRLEVDEPFEIRLDPGRNELLVYLDMPFRNSSAIGSAIRALKTGVDVVAGEKTPVEITLPALPSDVEFLGELKDACVSMPLDDCTTFVQFGGLEYAYSGNIEIRHLPHGLAQIAIGRPLPDSIFPSARPSRTVWESHWVEIPTEEALIELPELRAGCLEVVWDPSDRLPEPPYIVRAIPLFDDLPDEVRAVRRPEDLRATSSFGLGPYNATYLAPGRYVIEVDTEPFVTDETLTREVEIRHGETVRLAI